MCSATEPLGCVLERSSHALLGDGTVVELTAADRRAILKHAAGMSSQALRCLGMAIKTEGLGAVASYDGGHAHPGHKLLGDPGRYLEVESGLCFLGLAGLQDPPRAEVAPAIALCRRNIGVSSFQTLRNRATYNNHH